MARRASRRCFFCLIPGVRTGIVHHKKIHLSIGFTELERSSLNIQCKIPSRTILTSRSKTLSFFFVRKISNNYLKNFAKVRPGLPTDAVYLLFIPRRNNSILLIQEKTQTVVLQLQLEYFIALLLDSIH